MEFQSENKLYVLSGVSGSGKSEILNAISKNQILSFTTRKPRESEVNGKDYIFISEEKFEELLNTNGLIEHTLYSGNHYGITREEFEGKLSTGDTFFIADVHGMEQIKKVYPNTESIFIFSTKEDCEANMRDRGDLEVNIQKRIDTYDIEIANLTKYKFVITNKRGFLDDAIQDLKDLVYDI